MKMKIKILLGLLFLSLTSYVLANDGDSDKNDDKDYVVLALSINPRTFQYTGYPNVTFFVNISPSADQFQESELGNIRFYKIPKRLLDSFKLEGLVSIGNNLNANRKTLFTTPLRRVLEYKSDQERTIEYTIPGKVYSSTYKIRFRPEQRNITLGGKTFPIIYFSIFDIQETQSLGRKSEN